MAVRFKACSVENCNGNAHWEAKGARGWCSKHLQRWRKYGDPLTLTYPASGEIKAFFEGTILQYAGKDCLLWPFSLTDNGYGQIWIDGTMRGVHRVVCEAVHGPAPTPEHQAAHSCGNRVCCAPSHLRWATRKENETDKVAHGTLICGQSCNLAKLTEDDVREIRFLGGKIPRREIADRFQVSRSNIDVIISRKSWAWLD